MRVAYANARFRPTAHDGANAHVRQFVTNATSLGHELWMWPGKAHPATKELPSGKLNRIRQLREMDVLYVRVEHDLPTAATWTRGPMRSLLGSPIFVWEFNTVPEYGEYRKCSPKEIQKTIQGFRYYGQACDLAVCVSQHLADYVKKNLHIARTLVVPNGSDPDLFTPTATPVKRVTKSNDQFNVLWIGSAYVAWHNFQLLADAAQIIHDRGNPENVVFHLLGQGMNSMANMPPNVHYYGTEDYEKLPNWMSAMDVGLCLYRPGPADYSSPLKVFDYMSSALCVVATSQPQVHELFAQLNQTDLLVAPDDACGLANKLEALARDRARVKAQGEASRKLLIDKYTWRRAIVDTFTEIEKLSKRVATRVAL